ncbi:energy-coupling factor ABC transporter ATP-binding protein [Slackia exigua]|uniref:ABC transporter, ATP-binding protein n=1 Tax=Slackia exigua (strain ATCC 700122 / DSM 15923 / CIP 105133 / JCM 11022 / KCTC 5966 / S-7) TaxID=649764 RepID=D0WFY5_SLAES|nr:ABC transporter ATP-binding protein [Slackia exigua]EEZ61398.1 ABC transporter, ATP-binding protein [Slackia exigua ATCC 700122]STN99031.1 Nickel import ATP-binding protein NikO [Slackia exigua]
MISGTYPDADAEPPIAWKESAPVRSTRPDADREPPAHDHDAPHASRTPLMEFRDFCFAYDDEPVLSHIDLSIAIGDSAVLMGDNGSGKSTLLRAMNGLVFAQRGSYRFDGVEVDARAMKDASFAKRLHQRVGFVFQDSDAQLFCSSVEDEIAFGPRQMGLSEAETARRVDDACSMMGLDRLRSRAPYHLSGGEKKKVAIACIMSMNPDAYCFDEPLNGLDRKTRRWLLGFFKELKAAGKTLVIATHDQSLADEVADYFVYMGAMHGYVDAPHVHINTRA